MHNLLTRCIFLRSSRHVTPLATLRKGWVGSYVPQSTHYAAPQFFIISSFTDSKISNLHRKFPFDFICTQWTFHNGIFKPLLSHFHNLNFSILQITHFLQLVSSVFSTVAYLLVSLQFGGGRVAVTMCHTLVFVNEQGVLLDGNLLL